MKMLKLLLALPASTSTAERSFSALRRLKTYLRATMTATRLNSTSILHVHKDLANNINISKIMTDFITANDSRKTVFGGF
jgi:2-oxo-4-hydroxy-4-carboxy--5-ureidoimidazoline (OHCU) decarboxylase